MLLVVYILTMFLSATLLFLVQPMFTRMILPLLGGSPAVWNTAVVFYQTVLLAGYASAHLITSRLRVRQQVMLYGGLLLVPLLLLPISVPTGWLPPAETNPIPWLLIVLALGVGFPFFVLSTSSPILQRWFSYTDHPSADDPYFLYAASNVGSMLGLLMYPFVLERTLRLQEQSWLWTAGYVLYVVLMVASGLFVWRYGKRGNLPRDKQQPMQNPLVAPLSWGRRLRWVAWAAVPSSLMLSVTTYLSTNIAAIPLFWVVPLSLYLLTFVIVFSRKPIIPHKLMVRAVPIVLLPLIVVVVVSAADPIWILFPLHLSAFFIITMACHGALAQDRPHPDYLTAFFMWVSIGGAIGGMFNALVAPLLFDDVMEYPLMLALVAFFHLLPKQENASRLPPFSRQGVREWWAERQHRRDVWFPVAVGVLVAGSIVGVQVSGIEHQGVRLALMFVLPVLLLFSFSRRPLRFGLGIMLLVVLSSTLYVRMRGEEIFTERSFFGVHTVLYDANLEQHVLVHGTTLHGVQSVEPEHRCESLSYYHRTGPIGQIFTRWGEHHPIDAVALVGLGVGSLAAYSEAGQEWTYYEIDPMVIQIARNPQLFTYLEECAEQQVEVVTGDARLSLEQAEDAKYDVIVMDAYSSDAIPIHLITREALALYVEKLAPGGVLAFHVSNRYLNLKPVLAALAHDAGLVALQRDDMAITEEEKQAGKNASQWVMLARSREHLKPLTTDSRWRTLEYAPGMDVWTDDFASIFSVFSW